MTDLRYIDTVLYKLRKAQNAMREAVEPLAVFLPQEAAALEAKAHTIDGMIIVLETMRKGTPMR